MYERANGPGLAVYRTDIHTFLYAHVIGDARDVSTWAKGAR